MPAHAPFTLGVNLPWIRYGGDFGVNAWRPEGGIASPAGREAAGTALKDIAATGAKVVRWFLLCDGRAGLRRDDRGRPSGLDDLVLTDLDEALRLLTENGLRAMFVLFDFNWCRPVRRVKGVDLGGHRRFMVEGDARRELLDTVVQPLVSRFGNHPGIWAWDIINEPEWATLGVGTLNPARAISRDSMRAFITETAARIHEHATQPVTVGLASARWLPLVTPCGLDFYQVHWYDKLERLARIDRPVSDLGVDLPVVLGEFPTLGSRRNADELFDLARVHGYHGAFPWSWQAEDKATDRAAVANALRRAGGVDLRRTGPILEDR